MYVSYDTEARATYLQLDAAADVATTVEVSDSVMVDVDSEGRPIGVEFLVLPEAITPEMVDVLVARFAELGVLRDSQWRRVPV